MTPTTFDAETYSVHGTPRPAVRLPETVFDGTVNMPVMHQAVKAFLANQRQGNAATKIRKYVTGGNQKPWKQKGTGRARQGSIRAPHWVGGGTVFGPIPRSYAQYVPRQVRALARKSALNARARTGAVKVIDAFRYEEPSTRRLQQLLTTLGVADRKVLILTDGPQHDRVPERSKPADDARDAVQRRVHLSHPVVGCRARRSGGDRPCARAAGREPRRAGSGRRLGSRPVRAKRAAAAQGVSGACRRRNAARRAKSVRRRAATARRQRRRRGKRRARGARGEAEGCQEVSPRRRRGNNRCPHCIARSSVP